ARVTWASPRNGWLEELQSVAQTADGVILEMEIHAEREVFENLKPWNQGTYFASPWQTTTHRKRYFARFAGDSCDSYKTITRQMYFPREEKDAAQAWPPHSLPTLLDLTVLFPVPNAYQPFTAKVES